MLRKNKQLKNLGKFCKTIRQKPKCFDYKTKLRLNIFHTRYRLARNFIKIEATGFTEKTLRGYSTSIKLIIAYSAAEILAKVTDKNGIKSWNIAGKSIEKEMRNILNKPHERMDVIFILGKFRNKLDTFIKGKSNNLMIAANAIRIMEAHGIFTPFGTNTITKKNIQALEKLSELILEKAEQKYNVWMDNFLKKG